MEDLMILRLPPRLAARMGSRIDRHEKTKGGHGLFRRKRKNKGDKNEESVQVEAIWGDEVPDYETTEGATELFDVYDAPGTEENDSGDKDKASQNSDRESDTEEGDHDLTVEYWRVDKEGKDYIFKYGEDEYYATLISLPCVVEAQKSTDTHTLYKTGDIGQMLLVHDVKVASGAPRPEIDPKDLWQDSYAHGLTPPMYRVGPDRFAKVSSEARREELGVKYEDIQKADFTLNELKDRVLERIKLNESVTAAKSKRGAPPPGSIEFVYEELIDAEPWMEFAGDVVTIEFRDGKFDDATKEAEIKARENKRSLEEKKREGESMALPALPSILPNLGANLMPRALQQGLNPQSIAFGSQSPIPGFSPAQSPAPNAHGRRT